MIKMRTVEIAVGALMIAGIASLLMLALQVSGLSSFWKTESGYKVYAQFENIGSLKVRAKVSVAGVVVGRVTAVELDPNSFYAKVSMAIDADRSDKFPVDSQASIMTAGLLGDNYITLTPGFDTEYLQEGSVIPAENTHSALILEKLISKFLANSVSNDKNGSKDKVEKVSSSESKDSTDKAEKSPLKTEEGKEDKANNLPTPVLEKQLEH